MPRQPQLVTDLRDCAMEDTALAMTEIEQHDETLREIAGLHVYCTKAMSDGVVDALEMGGILSLVKQIAYRTMEGKALDLRDRDNALTMSGLVEAIAQR